MDIAIRYKADIKKEGVGQIRGLDREGRVSMF